MSRDQTPDVDRSLDRIADALREVADTLKRIEEVVCDDDTKLLIKRAARELRPTPPRD